MRAPVTEEGSGIILPPPIHRGGNNSRTPVTGTGEESRGTRGEKRGETAPRETDLLTDDFTLDFENWLPTRLKRPNLYHGSLSADNRRDRSRAAIVHFGEYAVAGRPYGSRQFDQVFELVYGEPLHFAPRRTTTRGSSRKKAKAGGAL